MHFDEQGGVCAVEDVAKADDVGGEHVARPEFFARVERAGEIVGGFEGVEFAFEAVAAKGDFGAVFVVGDANPAGAVEVAAAVDGRVEVAREGEFSAVGVAAHGVERGGEPGEFFAGGVDLRAGVEVGDGEVGGAFEGFVALVLAAGHVGFGEEFDDDELFVVVVAEGGDLVGVVELAGVFVEGGAGHARVEVALRGVDAGLGEEAFEHFVLDEDEFHGQVASRGEEGAGFFVEGDDLGGLVDEVGDEF